MTGKLKLSNQLLLWNFTNLVFLFLIIQCDFKSVQGTISVVSDDNNETVFSTLEAEVNMRSAYGLEGRLVLAIPNDACKEVSPPPIDTNSSLSSLKWILIATAGLNDDPCWLSTKAKNAQSAGYSGIILRRLGNNNSDDIIPPIVGFDWIGVDIYACSVGDYAGKYLMDKYTHPSRHFVRFENESYHQLWLIGYMILLGLLIFGAGVLFVKLCRFFYQCLYHQANRRRRRRRSLLTVSQLRKLPVLQWTSAIPQDTCSVCIELFEEGERIRVMPCSHVFHQVCIDPWLVKESRKCPNCKRRVVFPNENYTPYSDDSESSSVSGDERTPLLRGHSRSHRTREDSRFVEGLTESHNNRVLTQPPGQYQQNPGSSSSSASLNSVILKQKTLSPKVTFAPTSTGNSSNTVSTTNAFVLPKPSSKRSSTGRKPKLLLVDERSPKTSGYGATVLTDAVPVPKNVDHELSSNSSSSEGTLVEAHDHEGLNTEDDNISDKKFQSFTESSESKSLSFHSCYEFDGSSNSDENGGKSMAQSFASAKES